jgi:hypothetical protein
LGWVERFERNTRRVSSLIDMTASGRSRSTLRSVRRSKLPLVGTRRSQTSSSRLLSGYGADRIARFSRGRDERVGPRLETKSMKPFRGFRFTDLMDVEHVIALDDVLEVRPSSSRVNDNGCVRLASGPTYSFRSSSTADALLKALHPPPGADEVSRWTCGCGWTNGINLATCACCGRSPNSQDNPCVQS